MRVLVTGGSASGKSSFSEDVLLGMPSPRVYLATMRPWSKFDYERVERHRALRAGKGFETVERYRDVADLDLGKPSVMLECLSTLVANEMFDDDGNQLDCKEKVISDLKRFVSNHENVVLVTSEVGSDGILYPQMTQDYIETLGALNIEMAKICDVVIECVSGCPAAIKGALDSVVGIEEAVCH